MELLDSVWVVSTIESILVLLMGITGIRASGNLSAAGAAAVFGTIAFIFVLYMQTKNGGIIQQIQTGGAINPYVIGECIVVALNSFFANAVSYENKHR